MRAGMSRHVSESDLPSRFSMLLSVKHTVNQKDTSVVSHVLCRTKSMLFVLAYPRVRVRLEAGLLCPRVAAGAQCATTNFIDIRVRNG